MLHNIPSVIAIFAAMGFIGMAAIYIIVSDSLQSRIIKRPWVSIIIGILMFWLFVALSIIALHEEPKVTIAPDKQSGYTPSDIKQMNNMVAFVIMQNDVRELFGREGVE